MSLDSEGITGMLAVYYSAYIKILRGSSWRHLPEYRERILARCRKSLAAVLA